MHHKPFLAVRKEASDLNLNQPLQILVLTAASPSTDDMCPTKTVNVMSL